MNAPSIMTVIVGVVIAAGVLMFGQGGVAPAPIVAPDPPAPVITGLAEKAASDVATFANALAETCEVGAAKIDAGEFKDTKEAGAWAKERNDAARLAAFKPWHGALDNAKRVSATEDSLDKLSAAWKESAPGFRAAIRGAKQ